MFDAPNWFLTMMPIEPAKFVTNAIMKNSMNMIAIANTLPLFSLAIVFSFNYSLLTIHYSLITCAPALGLITAHVGSSP